MLSFLSYLHWAGKMCLRIYPLCPCQHIGPISRIYCNAARKPCAESDDEMSMPSGNVVEFCCTPRCCEAQFGPFEQKTHDLANEHHQHLMKAGYASETESQEAQRSLLDAVKAFNAERRKHDQCGTLRRQYLTNIIEQQATSRILEVVKSHH